MKKLYTFVLLSLLGWNSFSQCTETQQPKILLVGDSWAFFMGVDQTINTILNRWGHSNYTYYTNAIIAENGAETDDFLTQEKQDEIVLRLNENPSIEVVHLSIGGNDVLGDWDVTYTPEETDSLKHAVAGRLLQVIDFIKSAKPGIRIVWSGYTYPNFEEVIESVAPFQSSHPFYGTWEGMGFPSFLQINTLLNEFSDSIAAFAAADPQLDFVNATGLMQYTFGQNTPLGVAPGGTYPPQTAPQPLGYPEYPSPRNSMRDYAITKDCFHLSAQGYRDLIDIQFRKFYHKFLMDDLYLLPENNNQTGSVTASGTVSQNISLGEETAAVLSFNTSSMPDTVISKASIFLRRESVSGNNPISNSLSIKIKNGNFGLSAAIEAEDYAATGDAEGTACQFGSNNNGHWIRLDLPAQLLPHIKNDASTQFIITAPGFTGGTADFSGSADPEFAPVLNLSYGTSNISVTETETVQRLRLFPNPVNTEFTLDTHLEGQLHIEIKNLMGQTVYSIHTGNRQLDISHLSPAIYTVSITGTNGEFYSERLIKL